MQIALGGNPTAWILIFVVVLLLFGGQKIPEMMKGLGTGMREFKRGLREEDDQTVKDKEADEAHEREVRARVEAEILRERDAKNLRPGNPQ